MPSVAIFVAIAVALFIAVFLPIFAFQNQTKDARGEARERRMREHQMHARLLRLDL